MNVRVQIVRYMASRIILQREPCGNLPYARCLETGVRELFLKFAYKFPDGISREFKI